MPHNVISDALTLSERRPRRGLISFCLRNYTIILALAITFIMALSAWPYAPIWTAAAITLYWLYFFGKRRLQRHLIWGLPYHSKWVQFGRSLLLIAGTSIFLAYLYLGTDYLQESGSYDTLWLLFLLATFIMSQYGVTELMLVTIGLAAVALAALQLGASPHWDLALAFNVTFKVFWLALLAFILHILLRYIRDWYASIRLLHELVGEEIMPIRSRPEEKQLLETVVERIASDFDYPHVNILCLEPTGAIQYVAGACQIGRRLARAGYVLQGDHGIINHVAETADAYIANDVAQDAFYEPHPDFPETKAELAVPIKLRGELTGILDVQAHQKGVFFSQDKEVMEIVAGHLAGALDNLSLVKSRQQINEIVESIAHRFLSQNELRSTLDQIAQAAHDELKADVVVMYEQDPLTGAVIGPACAGELYRPEVFNLTVLEPDSLVYRLLAAAEEWRFHEDLDQRPEEPLFAPTQYHRRNKILPFDQREKIRSRAIICLRTDTERVGILFLNFRSPSQFDEPKRQTFYAFADLAALAIQKAQSHRQELEFERENLARQLHDQLMATTDGLSRIIASTVDDGPFPDRHRSKLELARDAVEELKRDLKYLNETLKDISLANLPEEVKKMTRRAESAYGVAFKVRWAGYGHRVPPAIAIQLKIVLNEAILNAIKHGEATRIDLAFGVTDGQVSMRIEDNGRGFRQNQRRRPGGLTNMQERVKKMGGRYELDSAPGQGTHISVTVPYAVLEGGKELVNPS